MTNPSVETSDLNDATTLSIQDDNKSTCKVILEELLPKLKKEACTLIYDALINRKQLDIKPTLEQIIQNAKSKDISSGFTAEAFSQSIFQSVICDRNDIEISVFGHPGSGTREMANRAILGVVANQPDLARKLAASQTILHTFSSNTLDEYDSLQSIGKMNFKINPYTAIVEEVELVPSYLDTQLFKEGSTSRLFNIFRQLLAHDFQATKISKQEDKFKLNLCANSSQDGDFIGSAFLMYLGRVALVQGGKSVAFKMDLLSFNSTIDSMKILGISETNIIQILRICVAILYLGGLAKETKFDEESESLQKVSEILSIPLDTLASSLVYDLKKINLEPTRVKYTQEEILSYRLRFAQRLYENIYAFICHEINRLLRCVVIKPKKVVSSHVAISVVDYSSLRQAETTFSTELSPLACLEGINIPVDLASPKYLATHHSRVCIVCLGERLNEESIQMSELPRIYRIFHSQDEKPFKFTPIEFHNKFLNIIGKKAVTMKQLDANEECLEFSHQENQRMHEMEFSIRLDAAEKIQSFYLLKRFLRFAQEGYKLKQRANQLAFESKYWLSDGIIEVEEFEDQVVSFIVKYPRYFDKFMGALKTRYLSDLKQQAIVAKESDEFMHGKSDDHDGVDEDENYDSYGVFDLDEVEKAITRWNVSENNVLQLSWTMIFTQLKNRYLDSVLEEAQKTISAKTYERVAKAITAFAIENPRPEFSIIVNAWKVHHEKPEIFSDWSKRKLESERNQEDLRSGKQADVEKRFLKKLSMTGSFNREKLESYKESRLSSSSSTSTKSFKTKKILESAKILQLDRLKRRSNFQGSNKSFSLSHLFQHRDLPLTNICQETRFRLQSNPMELKEVETQHVANAKWFGTILEEYETLEKLDDQASIDIARSLVDSKFAAFLNRTESLKEDSIRIEVIYQILMSRLIFETKIEFLRLILAIIESVPPSFVPHLYGWVTQNVPSPGTIHDEIFSLKPEPFVFEDKWTHLMIEQKRQNVFYAYDSSQKHISDTVENQEVNLLQNENFELRKLEKENIMQKLGQTFGYHTFEIRKDNEDAPIQIIKVGNDQNINFLNLKPVQPKLDETERKFRENYTECYALYDYQDAEKDPMFLTIKKKEVLWLKEVSQNKEWAKVYRVHDDKTGWVPLNYIGYMGYS